MSSPDNSILLNNGNITINPVVLQGLINVVLVGTLLTVGGTTVDLNAAIQTAYFTISDGANSTAINFSDVLTLSALDGLRFIVPANDVIQIGLPTARQHMQVLTWDETNGVAYRENNQCCAQTLSFDTRTNILCLSGTNCVDLTSINTDNQELSIIGNLLSISQLNSAPQTVDLSQVNEHTLDIEGERDCDPNSGTVEVIIRGSDGLENNRVLIPRPAITCCEDVMACTGIQAIITSIVTLTNRVIAAENAVQLLQGQLP